MTRKPSPPPAALLGVFRATEQIEQIAVMVDEDGFDAKTIRVLAAWQQTEQVWTEPRRKPPPALPTRELWNWICSGWTVDIAAIADAANVSRAEARQKIQVLMDNRLIYPDGNMANAARSAMRALVASRLQPKGAAPRRRKPKDDPPPGGDSPDEAN